MTPKPGSRSAATTAIRRSIASGPPWTVTGRTDAELADTARLIEQAEAKVEEHDIEADERHTAALVHTFRDRIGAADHAEALSAALAQGLAGLWAWLDDGELTVEFELAAPPDSGRSLDSVRYLAQHAYPVDFDVRRVTLPVHSDASPSCRSSR